MGMRRMFRKATDLLFALLVIALLLFGGAFTIGVTLGLLRDLFLAGWGIAA